MIKIAVDLDDVCLDFTGGLRAALKKEYNVELNEDDITDFNLGPFLNPIIGRSWWKWMRDREWLWANFSAVDGAMGALEVMHLKGHYLEILTSKPEWARHNVWKWIGKWRPPVDRVTIVGPEDKKVDFSDSMVLIDDKPQNIFDWEAAGRIGILFGRPYNKGSEAGAYYAPDGWKGVLDAVAEIEDLYGTQ